MEKTKEKNTAQHNTPQPRGCRSAGSAQSAECRARAVQACRRAPKGKERKKKVSGVRSAMGSRVAILMWEIQG